MKWAELREKWNEDPDWVQAFEEEYPFRDVAMAIVTLRSSLGLTQAQLAEMVGTQQSVVARLESGQHSVEIEFLNRIAHAVGRTWRPVFGEAEQLAPAVEEQPVLTYERIFPVAHPGPAVFSPPDVIRVATATGFIPSPAASRAAYEVRPSSSKRRGDEKQEMVAA
jgi:transcriptional regulator with XRE-family HTH domain